MRAGAAQGDVASDRGFQQGTARRRGRGRHYRVVPAVAAAEGEGGGRYPVGPARIEVDSVELIPFSAITAADVRRSGEPDRETLRRRAAHAGPIDDGTLLYRVEFHVVRR